MAVKIRLTRMGKKKQPTYRVVVMDSRQPRDGAYIDQIGFYDPRQDPSVITIDNDKALDWLHKGAQPTERAKKLLEVSGAWTRFKIGKGEIHTIAETSPQSATHTPEVHVVGGDAPEAPEDAPVDSETAVGEAPIEGELPATPETIADPTDAVTVEAAEAVEADAVVESDSAAETKAEES